MKYLALVLKSARRSKRRTALTIMSVAIAVFLFAALRAVLDGFNAATEASSSTRIVTQRSTSLFFSMPTSHTDVIRSTPGVQDLTWANWFGGVYKDPQNFFAQFAIEPESYLRLYPEIELGPDQKRAFLEDRTACIVGEGLAKRYGFKEGDRITLQVGIPIYGTRDFDFTVRGIYKSGGAAVDNPSMFFHWKYADERSIQKGQIGWYVAQIAQPDQATAISVVRSRTDIAIVLPATKSVVITTASEMLPSSRFRLPNIPTNVLWNACSVSVFVSFGELANFWSIAREIAVAWSGCAICATYHPICPF